MGEQQPDDKSLNLEIEALEIEMLRVLELQTVPADVRDRLRLRFVELKRKAGLPGEPVVVPPPSAAKRPRDASPSD